MMEQLLTAGVAGRGTGHSQFLTFTLDAEQYGIEILKVQEIKGYSAVTPIPNAPPYIKGVMNLRGIVVPVVDLRAKFSLQTIAYGKFTVIIVVTVGSKVMGLLVDAVSDVLDVPASQIRPAPDLGARTDTRFIGGIANVGDKMAVLLDIERLLGDDEITTLGNLARSVTAIPGDAPAVRLAQ
jgi:purine-binding chemotaxis protein CheW